MWFKSKKPKIMVGKGKEYSEVAIQYEEDLKLWLDASGITEEDLRERLDGETFDIWVFFSDEGLNIVMVDEDGDIGLPFILNGADSSMGSRMDASLLLLHISKKTTNKSTENKIRAIAKQLI